MSESVFRIGAATHVGMIRTMNEDAFIVRDHLVAVADGMGGHASGEVASAMAIDALGGLDGAVTVDSVVGAVLDANQRILERSRSDSSHRGMGTTLTALAMIETSGATAGDPADGDRELAVINLGDSRTYRFRDGRLEQVTIDHSYVQELVASGHLSPDEARYHPQRNIVTRALGIEPDVGVDVWNVPAVRGDRYLLCSDGLVDEVTDETIATVLAEEDDPQLAAEQLVDLANRSGGRDNVTVVVVDVMTGASSADDVPTMPVPVTDATLAAPRDLDDGEAEVADVVDVADVVEDEIQVTETGEPITDEVPIAAAALPPPPPVPEPDSVPASIPATQPAPSTPATADAPATSRRTNLKVLGVLGGLAVVVGIVFAAARGGDDSPSPTTPVTTTIVATTPASTAPPATAAPTTARPPTTIPRVPTTPTPTT